MASEGSQKLWATLGKIGVVVGILVGFVKLVEVLKPSGPKLVAYCEYSSYKPSPVLLGGSDSLRRTIASEGFLETIKSQFKSDESQISKVHLRNLISDFLKKNMEFLSECCEYRSQVIVKISNKGDRVAENVVIDIPISGTFRQSSSDIKSVVSKFENVVNVGAIRPGNSVVIELWSSDRFDNYLIESTHLTHSLGVGELCFPTLAYGIPAFVARNLWILLFIGMVLILFICLSISMFLTARGLSETANNSLSCAKSLSSVENGTSLK